MNTTQRHLATLRLVSRKRGRPPITSDGSVCASTMLPIPVYDAICQRAETRGVSVSKLIRDRLTTAPEQISGQDDEQTAAATFCAVLRRRFLPEDVIDAVRCLLDI